MLDLQIYVHSLVTHIHHFDWWLRTTGILSWIVSVIVCLALSLSFCFEGRLIEPLGHHPFLHALLMQQINLAPLWYQHCCLFMFSTIFFLFFFWEWNIAVINRRGDNRITYTGSLLACRSTGDDSGEQFKAENKNSHHLSGKQCFMVFYRQKKCQCNLWDNATWWSKADEEDRRR